MINVGCYVNFVAVAAAKRTCGTEANDDHNQSAGRIRTKQEIRNTAHLMMALANCQQSMVFETW